MKEGMMNKKTNWTAMVVLILGLSAIAFPLYMTIIIAFLCIGLAVKSALFPFHSWLPDACDRFLELSEKQPFDYTFDCGTVHYNSLLNGVCTWQK